MELHLQLGAGPQLHHQVTHKRRFEVPLNHGLGQSPLAQVEQNVMPFCVLHKGVVRMKVAKWLGSIEQK